MTRPHTSRIARSWDHDNWTLGPLDSWILGPSASLYVPAHQNAHAMPAAPQAMNTHRQLPCRRMAAIAGGAMTAPTAVPALTIPIAVDRSVTGNHSAMTFVAAGNPPPSPMPSRKRLAINMPTPVARLWLAHAS